MRDATSFGGAEAPACRISLMRGERSSRIFEGDETASHVQRCAAFDNAALVEPLRTPIDKVAKYASTITDDDIAVASASDFSEDQIFELVVCAAIGQAAPKYETALAALEAATETNEHAPLNPR